jgi:hypothetical protein
MHARSDISVTHVAANVVRRQARTVRSGCRPPSSYYQIANAVHTNALRQVPITMIRRIMVGDGKGY